MVLVGAIIAALAAGSWAWRYQCAALRHLRPLGPEGPEDAGAEVGAGAGAGLAAAAGRELAGTIVPTAGSSVLGWVSFTVVSVLRFDRTVLIGCRRPERSDDIRTIVLLIGDDERAFQATAMLEGWRARRTPLQLRPTEVSGAIELRDAGRHALRAPLLAA